MILQYAAQTCKYIHTLKIVYSAKHYNTISLGRLDNSDPEIRRQTFIRIDDREKKSNSIVDLSFKKTPISTIDPLSLPLVAPHNRPPYWLAVRWSIDAERGGGGGRDCPQLIRRRRCSAIGRPTPARSIDGAPVDRSINR